MLRIIEGNLLYATETYLCHQTNCVTQKAAHLSYDVFKRFPYANVYKDRKIPDSPGYLKVKGNGLDKRFVVNMFGQYYPGKSRYPGLHFDGKHERLFYFEKCLHGLMSLDVDLERDEKGTFAMPYGIGCGAAGGDWIAYLELIKEFSEELDITLYKLKDSK